MPQDAAGDIAEIRTRGEPPTPDELEAAIGIRELAVGEVTDEALLGFNDPSRAPSACPAAAASMRAADLALYYQALLHNPGEMWEPGRAGRRDRPTCATRSPTR